MNNLKTQIKEAMKLATCKHCASVAKCGIKSKRCGAFTPSKECYEEIKKEIEKV